MFGGRNDVVTFRFNIYGVFLAGGNKAEYGALISPVPARSWFYAAADFGGRVTLWAAYDGYIYCSFRPGGTRVIRPVPDGRPDTVIMCPDIRKRLTLLRSAWNRGRVDAINAVFGTRVYLGNEKPTNSEFIALVADKLILENMM